MNHLTPESEQRAYVERARKQAKELTEGERKRLRVFVPPEEIVPKMPQYPRD